MADCEKILHETDAKPYSRNIFTDPKPCNQQKTEKEQDETDSNKKTIFDKSSQRNLLDVLGGHPDLWDLKSKPESVDQNSSKE